MKKVAYCFCLIFIAFCYSAFSFQNEETKKDTSDSSFFSDWTEWYGIRKIERSTNYPSIDFYWGNAQSSFKLQDYKDKFPNIGDLTLKIGFTRLKTNESIIKSSSEQILFQGLSSSFLPSFEEKQDDIELSAWRAGIENASGYGYEFSDNIKLILFNSNALIWTHIEFKDSTIRNDPLHIYDTYNKSIRFGDKFEGGIKIQLLKPLGISASYERSIVFPRHLFWYWLGSELIEGIGHGLIDGFVRTVVKSNSVAAPIVAFVLKNGYSYFIYELRTENMNWPFDTAAPLHFQTYKIGFSFMF